MEQHTATRCVACMKEKPEGKKCPHCGFVESSYVPSAHQLPPRTLLGGKFMLGRVIGEGGFGITYIAWDMTLNMVVAIKEYFPAGFVTRNNATSNALTVYQGDHLAFFEHGRDAFVEEARILARFFSLPGVVTVKDCFQENGTAYIVMEYIYGIHFARFAAEKGGRLPVPLVLDMMRLPIDSLTIIHGQGLMHRDISPENLMVAPNGYVKLIDFGASRAIPNPGAGRNSVSVIIRPGFAPEEQYRTNGMQGPWTDCYALCATMYALITGANPPEALERVIEDKIVPPSALGVSIAPGQEAALMKGLAVFAKDRFPSVEALREALYREPSASPAPAPAAAAPAAVPVPTPTPVPATAAAPSAPPPPSGGGLALAAAPAVSRPKAPRPKRGKGAFVKWLLAGCLVLGILLFFLVSQPQPQPAPGLAPDGSILFSDKAFESMLRTALERQTEPIFPWELTRYSLLVVNGNKLFLAARDDQTYTASMTAEEERGPVGTLTDLVHFPALEELSVLKQNVKDLTPLSALSHLRQLDLSGNPLESLAPLSGLTGLTKLTLANCGVQELSFLESLGVLTDLNLRGNRVQDLSPLKRLSFTLSQLDLSDNAIQSLGPLSGLKALSFLYLSGNQITDPGPLVALSGLRALNLSGNGIPSITPLSGMKQLRMLNLSSTQVSDLGPLQGLVELSTLQAQNTPVTDWWPVAHVPTVDGRPDGWETLPRPLAFADPAFERMLRAAFNKPEGTLYDTDLSPYRCVIVRGDRLYLNVVTPELDFDLPSLMDPAQTPVARLDDLVYFPDLETLYLPQQQISDLAPLSGLTALTQLHLSGNQIHDISPLSGLTGLERLNLSGNQVADLSPLSAMSGLTYLHLGENSLQDLAPLAGLTRLTFLNLRDNSGVRELAPLGGLKQLETLDLSNNTNYAGFDPLSKLTDLTTLYMNHTGVESLSFLSRLKSLRTLYLRENHISDLSPLAGLSKLAALYLSPLMPISDWSPVDHVGIVSGRPQEAPAEGVAFHDPAFEKMLRVRLGKDTGPIRPEDLKPYTMLMINGDKLQLSATDVPPDLGNIAFETPVGSLSSLADLVYFPSLTQLTVARQNIVDLAPIAQLSKLNLLVLSQNRIADLSPLSGLKELGQLVLRQNNITDLAPLQSLTSLSSLDLSQNPVSDLSPLASLRELRFLSLDEARAVSDLSPLSKLTKLQDLYVGGTGIDDISALSSLNSLQNLDIDETGVSDLSPLRGLSKLEMVKAFSLRIADWSPVDHVATVYGRP